ncbi:MAG: hypothetical protein JWL69_4746 [Phycisphaerales bacterium]|nr:hypothetical protein [Phycisphaerales bacterium]
MAKKALQLAAPTPPPESSEKPAATEPYGLVPIRTTSVKNFALTWIVTLAACFPVFGLIAAGWVTYYRSPDAAWINFMCRQKEVMLDRRAAQGHRLIIVGGSNALFGIDGELIERKLHVPTVNYGLHAALGLNYMLSRASKKMQPGDTILLDPEYDNWSDRYRYIPGPAFEFLFTYDKPYLLRMPIDKTAGMIASIPLSDWAGTRRQDEYKNLQATAGYSIGSMSPSGDMRVNVGYYPQITDQYPFIRNPDAPGYVALRAFGAETKARGIRVLMTWPNYARPVPDVPPEMKTPPEWFARQMAEDGVTVLNKPTDTSFPNEWFMDTAYHANQCCRRVRTEELIQLLRPQLGLPSVPAKPTGIFLVAGTRHRLTEGNLFADDPGVRFRYLRTEDPSDLPALTAAQVAALVKQGMPVYTDSEEAGNLLATAGLSQQLSATGSTTIAQWFARYPAHIFLLAAPPDHPLDPVWKSVLPAMVYDGLCVNAPVAAAFGSGPYSSYRYIKSNEKGAHLSANLPKLFHQPSMIPTHIEVHALARDGGGPSATIEVDYNIVANAAQGISVSVIDPGIGAVIETVTFGEGPDLETWRRYSVVDSTPATRP